MKAWPWFLSVLPFVGAVFAAFLTHIFWTVVTLTAGAATAGQIAFAVLGIIVPPLGTLHGLGLWFGWFAW